MPDTPFRDYFTRLETFQKNFQVELPPDPITSGWQISRSGNLYLQYRSITLTLFPGKRSAKYSLCVAGPVGWGRRFYDLGAGNLDAAVNEAIRKADHTIADDRVLARFVKAKEGE